MHTNINLVIGNIAVLICLFPWVGFNIIDSDSQPWPIIAFTTYLFSCGPHIKSPRNIGFMSLMLTIGFCISLVSSHAGVSLLTLRAAYNYSSILLIFIGFYNYIYRHGFPTSLFFIGNIIWLACALLEIYYPEIKNLLAPTRTSPERGVTSLSPEPTFYAIFLFFSSWLLLISNNYRFRSNFLNHAINITSIGLLAKSSMGILYLFLAYGQNFIYNSLRLKINTKFLKSIILFITLSLTSYFIFYLFFEDTRLFQIISSLIYETTILDLFFLDASMNERLESVVFSIHGSIINYFIPAGFDTFIDYRRYLVEFYNGFFWYSEGTLKIMSWIGDFIFQLGFFGIAFLSSFFNGAWDKSYRGFLELLFLFIILLSAIPLAFPLTPMLFSLLYYRKNNLKHR